MASMSTARIPLSSRTTSVYGSLASENQTTVLPRPACLTMRSMGNRVMEPTVNGVPSRNVSDRVSCSGVTTPQCSPRMDGGERERKGNSRGQELKGNQQEPAVGLELEHGIHELRLDPDLSVT